MGTLVLVLAFLLGFAALGSAVIAAFVWGRRNGGIFTRILIAKLAIDALAFGVGAADWMVRHDQIATMIGTGWVFARIGTWTLEAAVIAAFAAFVMAPAEVIDRAIGKREQKPVIMIVEDDPIAGGMLQEMIAGDAFTARYASLSDALRALGHGAVHGVILDLNLSDSTGIETFKRITQATHVPICVLSGAVDDDLRYLLKRAGAAAVLEKSICRTEDLRRYLGEVSLHRALNDDRIGRKAT